MSVNPPQRNNTYMIDPESGAEMARLIEQDRLLTEAMGGLFPPGMDLSRTHSILDLACGPGGWVQEVAFAHPEIKVTGIDISQKMIQYAASMARAQGLDNVSFQVMDATMPLAFPDNTFDFVNARYLVGFMSAAGWPRLVAECLRVTRPGGILRFTECDDIGTTSSPAYETMKELIARAGQLSGRNLAPGGRNAGITPLLGRFLREAGCELIQRQAHVLDFSQGAKAAHSNYQNFIAGARLLQAFVVKMGVTTPQEWDALYERALTEMLADDFCGLWYFLSTWGQKPD